MNYFNPQQYKGSRFQMNAFLHWLKKSNINMDRQITVLDAGCGDGSIAEYLLQNYPSLSLRGFDASEKQVSGAIQRCQRFQDRSKFLVGTFDSIPVTFKDDPVDLVIASYSLHLAPSMERAIRNLADRVKPEGELLVVIPTIAPYASRIYHDGMKDPRFSKYLVQMKDMIHDEHPNGLRYWEELNPEWMKPDMVYGLSKIAISSGLVPLLSLHTIRHGVLSEEEIAPIVNGINPFIQLIPKDLHPEFQELSINSCKKAYLPIRQADGSLRFNVGQELVLYARKL